MSLGGIPARARAFFALSESSVGRDHWPGLFGYTDFSFGAPVVDLKDVPSKIKTNRCHFLGGWLPSLVVVDDH